jgi:hypothetical protein
VPLVALQWRIHRADKRVIVIFELERLIATTEVACLRNAIEKADGTSGAERSRERTPPARPNERPCRSDLGLRPGTLALLALMLVRV